MSGFTARNCGDAGLRMENINGAQVHGADISYCDVGIDIKNSVFKGSSLNLEGNRRGLSVEASDAEIDGLKIR